MNKNKLKAKMIEFEDNAQNLAEYLGICRSRLSAKINEYKGAEFTQTEISKIIERYKLSTEDTTAIFFSSQPS